MDHAVFTNVHTVELGGNRTSISYHARMPVAWGSKTNLPKKYTFKLPKNADGFAAFTTKYGASCSEFVADPSDPTHQLDEGSMWYYYRPSMSGCKLDSSDAVSSRATVTVSAANTTGKYPEYDKVWADNELRVVAIFGKYEKGHTDEDNDAGINAYNEFNRSVREELGALTDFATTPLTPPRARARRCPTSATPPRSPTARSSSSTRCSSTRCPRPPRPSIRATRRCPERRHDRLQRPRRPRRQHPHPRQSRPLQPRQYSIVFMNGCDTYTYIDGALAQKHAALNPDDPNGTKYMDMVVNAMPEFFQSDSEASMALIKALKSYDAPKTYETIFDGIDSRQIVLVTGELDNTFHP